MQVSLEALKKRHAQGWLHEMESDLDYVILRIRTAKRNKQVHRSVDLLKSYIVSRFWTFMAFSAVRCGLAGERTHYYPRPPSALEPIKGPPTLDS